MSSPIPTIKGIFVNSHIKAVRQAKGEAGVKELEKRFGGSMNYKNLDDVPVSDEIKIIELALDILSEKPIPIHQRAFEAGRLHFRNFATTPLAKILLSFFTDPKKMFLNSKYIAEHVFNGITYSAEDLDAKKIRVIMTGGVYPLDHFKGLFHEWVKYMGYTPKIEARQTEPETYEYTLEY